MLVTKIPRSKLEEMARAEYARQFPSRPAQTAPRPRNVRPTLYLLEQERVEVPFRGRMYELRPVSFADGIRLLEAEADISECVAREVTGRDAARQYAAAARLIIRMAPRYLLPRGRVRRLFWRLRLRRNPFRKATDAEVGEILGFLFGCRTMSSVRYPGT